MMTNPYVISDSKLPNPYDNYNFDQDHSKLKSKKVEFMEASVLFASKAKIKVFGKNFKRSSPEEIFEVKKKIQKH